MQFWYSMVDIPYNSSGFGIRLVIPYNSSGFVIMLDIPDN